MTTGAPILVVDDAPVSLKLMRLLLTHEGYQVRTAERAEEALEMLSDYRPDLILADIPVVRLRDGLPRGLLTSRRSYSELVAAAQETVERAELIVDFGGRALVCGGKRVSLPPITFAFAAWYLSTVRRIR